MPKQKRARCDSFNTIGHSDVLEELHSALPVLASHLEAVLPSLPDYGSNTLTAINPGGTERLLPTPPPPGAPAVAMKAGLESSGMKNMSDEPASRKAKFSSITGPDIYYDGTSQRCLFNCFTALTARCAALHYEMRQIRRKSILRQTTNSGYSDSEDELEGAAETAESRRRRINEELLGAEGNRKNEVLKYVSGCLDQAAKACENAATVWLNGEGCIGHVVFITARMMDAVHKVNAELSRHVPSGSVGKAADHPPEEELLGEAPAAPPSPLTGDAENKKKS